MNYSKTFSSLLIASSVGLSAPALAATQLLYSFDPHGVDNPQSNLMTDDKGTLAYGATDTELYRLNVKDGTIQTLAKAPYDAEKQENTAFASRLVMSQDGRFVYGTANSNTAGVVFRYDLNANTFTILHHFDLDNDFEGGYDAKGPLALSKDGKTLYGITYSGGKENARNEGGVIYALTTDETGKSSYRVIHAFSSTSGGNHPASLVLSADEAYLYGSTQSMASPYDCGALYRVNLAQNNAFSVLKSLSCTAQQPRLNDMVLTQNGKTMYASASGTQDGSIVKIDLSAKGYPLTTLHTFNRNNDEGVNPSTLVLSTDEHALYGMNQGLESRGRFIRPNVFKMALDAEATPYRVISDFSPYVMSSPVSLRLVPSIQKLYFMSQYGGVYQSGALFSLDTESDA